MLPRNLAPLPNHDCFELWTHEEKLSFIAFLAFLCGSRKLAQERWNGLIIARALELAD